MAPELPSPWHALEVGTHDSYKFGVAMMEPECGCSTEAPCATLCLYYGHNLVPDVLPHGKYRMRLGAHGYLEVEHATEEGM